MYKLFLISMSFIVNIGFSQSKIITADKLVGKFTFNKGGFPNENILLTKLNPQKEIIKATSVCVFNADSTIEINALYPKGIIACRKGLPFVEKSNWTLNKNELHIYLKGEYLSKDITECEAIYTIELIKNELVLKRKKLILSK